MENNASSEQIIYVVQYSHDETQITKQVAYSASETRHTFLENATHTGIFSKWRLSDPAALKSYDSASQSRTYVVSQALGPMQIN